ncbi:hypothetical protein [Paenibacillus sp. MMS18-CY102]|uniref:hypothetical protein n=1 Tax=Paenibacillus sp. MMS18-CY102 TaxID=2682849 RepID=UPI0013657B30|nr:hypothetical protein [Paenibacillus sp. MMS18-CY102]MWC30910.1 hypothetical protein [Paenibacillus sp. MMS18-CY102]
MTITSSLLDDANRMRELSLQLIGLDLSEADVNEKLDSILDEQRRICIAMDNVVEESGMSQFPFEIKRILSECKEMSSGFNTILLQEKKAAQEQLQSITHTKRARNSYQQDDMMQTPALFINKQG